VEQICAYQKWGHQKALQYLIKWKGYPKSDNTWENANQIHAPALIKLYHQTSTSDSIKAWGIQLKQHPLPVLSPPKAFTRSTPLLPTILRDTTATLVWSNVHKNNIRLACSPPLDPQVQSPSTLTPHTVTIHNHAYQKLFSFVVTHPSSLLPLPPTCIRDRYVVKLHNP
jgi:Chromo (CHRromatin Organisation MOdifier) domain